MSLEPQWHFREARGGLLSIEPRELAQRQRGGRERVHAVIEIIGTVDPNAVADCLVVRRAGRRGADGEAALNRWEGAHVVPEPHEMVARPFGEDQEGGMHRDAERAKLLDSLFVARGRASLVHAPQLLVGRELEADEDGIETDLSPAVEEAGIPVHRRRASPGEVTLFNAASRECLSELPSVLRVDEVLVVDEVDVVGRCRGDLVCNEVGGASAVLAVTEIRDDAEGTAHPAAVRRANERDARVDRRPSRHVFAEPYRAVRT